MTRQTWEYFVESLTDPESKESRDHLDQTGKYGWEVVSAWPTSQDGSTIRILYKRPKE